MNELISVVIPIYNVEKYLDKCLETVTNQTYKKIEIILVDDGSTDNSGDKCELWKKKDKRIVVIHKKNGGLSSARNAGIDIARGKYITFVDSDDYVDYSMIEILNNKINKYKADISICNRYYLFEDGRTYLRFKKNHDDLIMNSERAIYEMNNFKHFDMSAWAKMYKTDLFKDIKFPVGKLSEDYFIMYLLFDKADKIVYNSTPLYYYLQRSGSISKAQKINFDFVEAAYSQLTYVEKKYPNLEKCVRAAYVSANMTVYDIVLKNNGKCDLAILKNLQSEVNKNFKFVKDYDGWKALKKIQAFLFIKCIHIYNLLFKSFKFIKKV